MVNVFYAKLAQKLEEGGSETIIYLDRLTTRTGEEIDTSVLSLLGRGILSIDPEADGLSSQPEFASFTGVDTVNIALTGAIRGLSALDNSIVPDNVVFHETGTPVIISFGVHDFLDIVDYINAQFDSVVIGTNTNVVGTAGETIAANDIVYFRPSDQRWWKVNAATATTVYSVEVGVARGAGTAGGLITNGVTLRGRVSGFTGFTPGSYIYATNTGTASNTPGTYSRPLGVAISSSEVYFDPGIALKIPQDALSTYAVDSVGTDSYAITLSPAPGGYTDGMMVSFKAGIANTGACTLNVNGLGAKTIKKFGIYDTATGDIEVGQIVKVIYDGTNFQMINPTSSQLLVRTIYSTAGTSLGSSTTQFDITNTSGTTYRYTYDGTGTDPNFSSVNNPVGSLIQFRCQNFTAANNGLFVVTNSGTNFVEVTNASGVGELNKTIGTGSVQRQTSANGTWTKPTNLRYITVEVAGGGGAGGTGVNNSRTGGGGGAGGYSSKQIPAFSLGSTEKFMVGALLCPSTFGVTQGIVGYGGTSATGTSPGAGGTASGGDINLTGTGGNGGISIANVAGGGASGGSNPIGIGGGGGAGGLDAAGSSVAGASGGNGTGYGAGGGGGGVGNGVGGGGGTGTTGGIIITEYYV